MNNHQHCKECGNVYEEMGRSPWTLDKGVTYFYICEVCRELRIEYENSDKVKSYKF